MTKTTKLALIIGGAVVALALAIILPIVLTATPSYKVSFLNADGTTAYSAQIAKGKTLTEEDAKLGDILSNGNVVYAIYDNEDLSGDALALPLTIEENTTLYIAEATVINAEDFTYTEEHYAQNFYFGHYSDYTGEQITTAGVIIEGIPEKPLRGVVIENNALLSSDFANLKTIILSPRVKGLTVGAMNLFDSLGEIKFENFNFEADSLSLKGFDNSGNTASSNYSYDTYEEMYQDKMTDSLTDTVFIYWKV